MAHIWFHHTPAHRLIAEAIAAELFPEGTYSWSAQLGTEYESPHVSVAGLWRTVPMMRYRRLDFTLAQWQALSKLPAMAEVLPHAERIPAAVMAWAASQIDRYRMYCASAGGHLARWGRWRSPDERLIAAAQALLREHATTLPCPDAPGSRPASASLASIAQDPPAP